MMSPDSPQKKTLTDLPESYTDVQPVAVQVDKEGLLCSKSVNPSKSDLIGEGMKSECDWLDKVKKMLEKGLLSKDDYISQSAHFASLQAQAL